MKILADEFLESGGTGLGPVVSGVAPETVLTATPTLAANANPQSSSSNEIRRDAEFDGRDARATIFQ